MTISEMTDDELVRAVAEEVMGWSLVEHEDCEWWDTGVDNGRYWAAAHFVPLLDYNHTFVVVERMRELRWKFVTDNEQNWAVRFYREGESKAAINPNLKRAILDAALEAVRRDYDDA